MAAAGATLAVSQPADAALGGSGYLTYGRMRAPISYTA